MIAEKHKLLFSFFSKAYQLTTCDVMSCQKHTGGPSDNDVYMNDNLSELSMSAGWSELTSLLYRAGVTPSASASHWCHRRGWLRGAAMIKF